MKRLCVDLKLTVEVEADTKFNGEELALNVIRQAFDSVYLDAFDGEPEIFGLKVVKSYYDEKE